MTKNVRPGIAAQATQCVPTILSTIQQDTERDQGRATAADVEQHTHTHTHSPTYTQPHETAHPLKQISPEKSYQTKSHAFVVLASAS